MKTLSSPETQGYRDFDLPREHLLDERHWVPPKTHDQDEAGRRRDLNTGTLIAEQQRTGLHVARVILSEVNEEEGRMFATQMIARAGLNTAWYSYAERATDVMRRRLKLPIMVDPRSQNPALLLEDGRGLLAKAEQRTENLITYSECMREKLSDAKRMVGVTVGNAALRLAMYEPLQRGVFVLPEETKERDLILQERARKEALGVLYDARTMHREAGAHPSIAQLSDPYSHLAVYWHRHAPGSAQHAVRDALAG